jgi:Na+-translocating ferredoxin:NAD+ oxidoreductase RnfG subunit
VAVAALEAVFGFLAQATITAQAAVAAVDKAALVAKAARHTW